MTPTQRRELALISARLRTIRGQDGELLKDRTLLSSEAIDAVCEELLRLHNAAESQTKLDAAYVEWLATGAGP